MVLGSLYLHTRALSWGAFAASLVPGLLIMALAVVNAIPDYHQDRLVGKRNLVVRLGRRRGGLALSRARGSGARRSSPVGVAAGVFPRGVPRRAAGVAAARRERARARCAPTSRRGSFVPAIRAIVAATRWRVTLFAAGIARAGLSAVAATSHRQPAARRSSCRGSSRAIATSPACIAAPIRRRASACADELDADEALRVAGEIVRNERPVRHAVRRRAAGRAAFLRAGRSARARGRAAQDRDQRPAVRCAASPSGSPGCRSARSR